jgi:hypothetical protein
MKNRSSWVLLGLVMAGSVALATSTRHLRADLTGFEEVPPVSTTGSGHLRLVVFPDNNAIHYDLSYSALETDATQAHIHFGQMGVNGGISAFLCSNLGNGPEGTQACPLRGGRVSGMITPPLVIGPAGQGITSGQFTELLEALRSDVTYVNVHSVQWPGGEIRGQIDSGRSGRRN